MFVLSVEGPAFVDKGTWSTHKILGVFDTEEAALAYEPLADMTGEDIVLITDTSTGLVDRIPTGDDDSEE